MNPGLRHGAAERPLHGCDSVEPAAGTVGPELALCDVVLARAIGEGVHSAKELAAGGYRPCDRLRMRLQPRVKSATADIRSLGYWCRELDRLIYCSDSWSRQVTFDHIEGRLRSRWPGKFGVPSTGDIPLLTSCRPVLLASSWSYWPRVSQLHHIYSY
jgi:hypothetical protein